MTSRPFTQRFENRKGNNKHKHQKGTKLSSYVWKQKDFWENTKNNDIKWRLNTKAVPHMAGARFCDICIS